MAKKILLADDSLTIQKVVELTFSDNDYDLVCVGNGQKALERVWEDHPDLILADVVMPEKNGYEVCEVIKSNPSTARIPVVLLSGTFEPFDRERAERIGCDAIVSKPFDSQQLLSQVEALLAKSAASRPEAAVEEPVASRQATRSVAEDESPFETGFDAEDFTGSHRLPRDVYRPDPFEEEFGRGDVDSAIVAFETERAYGSGSEVTGEIRLPREEPSRGAGEPGSWRSSEPSAPWLMDEPEPSSSPEPRRETPRTNPGIWGEGDPGNETTEALTFESETTAEIPLSSGSTLRADEAPTSEIRMDLYAGENSFEEGDEGGAARFENRSGASAPPQDISAFDAEILFDVESSDRGAEGEDPFSDAEALPGNPMEDDQLLEGPDEALSRQTAEAAQAALAERASNDEEEGLDEEQLPADAEPIALPETELEALAQNASIPELTNMLSSVRRSDGGLSEADIDRLASRVVEKLSERIVREIAWEVIPDMAEIVIKQRIKELEAGVE